MSAPKPTISWPDMTRQGVRFLFMKGWDSLDIARHFHVHESVVWGLLRVTDDD